MRKRRVIVIDDEPIIISMFKFFFSRRNYEVFPYAEPMTCSTFNGGFDECVMKAPCADVLVTDFNLPGMNGLDLLRKQLESGCKVPIKNKAVISAYVDEDTAEKIKELGYAYFEKPIDLDAFSEWLVECEQRTDLSQPLDCTRHEPRHKSQHKIRYRTDQSQEIYHASTINISDNGLCLTSDVPLVKEQKVWLHTELPLPHSMALVCWVSRTTDGSYLAGLRCC